MSDAAIKAITIKTIKKSSSFDGELVVISVAELSEIFARQNTFKSKFYTLLSIESGSGKINIDNEQFELKKGRVFFVNYSQIFQFNDLKDLVGEAVIFTQSFYNLIYTGNRKIKNDTAFSDLPSFVEFSRSDFVNFKASIADIKREYLSSEFLGKEIICLLLKISMLKYIRKTNNTDDIDFKTNRKNSYLNAFKKLIEIHFKDLKRTSDYSKSLAISANYLNALVKEKLEISAEQLIQDRVILEAERLLLNTDLSVTEISFELGFSDKSHFGKYFKKKTDESPNKFRKKFQRN